MRSHDELELLVIILVLTRGHVVILVEKLVWWASKMTFWVNFENSTLKPLTKPPALPRVAAATTTVMTRLGPPFSMAGTERSTHVILSSCLLELCFRVMQYSIDHMGGGKRRKVREASFKFIGHALHQWSSASSHMRHA